MTGRTPINQQRDKRPGDTARWRTGGAHARADTENRLPIYRNRVPGKWSITKKREVCLPFFFLYYYYFFFFLRNDSIHADLLLLSRFCRLSYRSFLLVDLYVVGYYRTSNWGSELWSETCVAEITHSVAPCTIFRKEDVSPTY